jgi:C4-dicarboxylate-specific signal transduction histidine kinase
MQGCPHCRTCLEAQEHAVEVDESRLGGSFLVTTTPRRDAQGTIVGTVHVARDVTRLKQTEKALHAMNLDLERRVAEQTAAIRRSYETVRVILRDVIRDTERAESVVHGLHAMLQKGKLEHETLCPNDLIHEVAQLLRSEFVGRNASLSVDITGVLPVVKAKRVELQQVLVNLLVNALDAVKNQPASKREILLRARSDGPQIVINVRDRGCGIHSSNLETVFEPYFTTKPTGLGMGLAICRRIIQSHDGHIWATNNQDGGATVSFSIPSAHP